jgi:hypothetical protein
VRQPDQAAKKQFFDPLELILVCRVAASGGELTCNLRGCPTTVAQLQNLGRGAVNEQRVPPLVTGAAVGTYYNDPDGNMVELLCDAYDDHEKSRAKAGSEEVWNNPPGTPVDPRKLLDARRGGMSLEELHERAYAGEFLPEEQKDQKVHDYDDEILNREK